MSSCVRITTHITCRCTTKRSTSPRERSVCQDACVSQHTLRAGEQHSGRRETRVRRRCTSQIVTDGVPTHPTTFVHAGAWIVTLNLLCGVPAHTTTVVHAGAYTVNIDALFGVPAHTTTLVDPHGKDACAKLRTYHNTHYVPVHNIAVNPPTGKKRVSRCVRITIHITCRCQHSVRRDGGDTRHR